MRTLKFNVEQSDRFIEFERSANSVRLAQQRLYYKPFSEAAAMIHQLVPKAIKKSNRLAG